MKKIALIILLAAAVGGWSPGSCIPLAIFQASTASINNPVTKDMLNDVESGAIIAFAGLRAYKRSCVELAIPQSCRRTIQSIQVYTRKLEQILPSLRAFVRENDQVNAVLAYNAVVGLIADFKSEAGKANIKLGVS